MSTYQSMLFRLPTPTCRKALNVKEPRYHVCRPWQLLTVKSVHSESVAFSIGQVERRLGEAETIGSNQKPDNLTELNASRKRDRDGKKLFRGNAVKVKPRQVTLAVNYPTSTSQKQILQALTHFRTSKKYWNIFSQDPGQAVVILATPSFSKWLEDDSFIAKFLGKITRRISNDNLSGEIAKPKTQAENVKSLEIDVVCACVDGLSPEVDWIPNSINHRPREGLSILQGRTSKMLPNLWDTESSITKQNPVMTASLTFSKPTNSRDQSHVILPLANTLFSNGRYSTLLVSKWRAEKDSFTKIRSSEKSNQTITVFDDRRLKTPTITVPAIPLTPARRIISGLGNIIKQVDFGEQGVGPASRELEANIDDYLSQSGRSKSTLGVWALVVPKAAMSLQDPAAGLGLLFDTNQVKSQWQNKLQSQNTLPSTNFISYWISLGAKFCRVLSGGGGWGVKQGLLSLDPQSTYTEISEARFDFSTGSLEEQQTSALGEMAEPDAYIQFFVSSNTIPAATTSTSQKPTGVDTWRTTTVIGTAPSTVDDQRTDASHSTTVLNVAIQRGHFGAVSESGLFLGASSVRQGAPKGQDRIIEQPAIQTKIDLPHSYVYRDLRLEKTPPRFKVKQETLQPAFRMIKYFYRSNPQEVPAQLSQGLEPTVRIRKHLARSEISEDFLVQPTEKHLNLSDTPKKLAPLIEAPEPPSPRRYLLDSAPKWPTRKRPLNSDAAKILVRPSQVPSFRIIECNIRTKAPEEPPPPIRELQNPLRVHKGLIKEPDLLTQRNTSSFQDRSSSVESDPVAADLTLRGTYPRIPKEGVLGSRRFKRVPRLGRRMLNADLMVRRVKVRRTVPLKQPAQPPDMPIRVRRYEVNPTTPIRHQTTIFKKHYPEVPVIG